MRGSTKKISRTAYNFRKKSVPQNEIEPKKCSRFSNAKKGLAHFPKTFPVLEHFNDFSSFSKRSPKKGKCSIK